MPTKQDVKDFMDISSKIHSCAYSINECLTANSERILAVLDYLETKKDMEVYLKAYENLAGVMLDFAYMCTFLERSREDTYLQFNVDKIEKIVTNLFEHADEIYKTAEQKTETGESYEN